MDKIKVEINSTYSTGDIRAYATAIIDDSISIRGIKLMDDDIDGVYVSMPTRNGGTGSKVLCNIYSDDFSMELEEALLYAYDKALDVEQDMDEVPTNQCEVDMKNIHISIGSVYDSSENDGIRAYAIATIDENIDIKEIKVMDDGDTLSVVMPRRKTVDGYKEVCSIVSEEYKAFLHRAVLDSYHQTLALTQEQAVDGDHEQDNNLAEELEQDGEPVIEDEQTQQRGGSMQMGSM